MLNQSKRFVTPVMNRSFVVYSIDCLECPSQYIGMTSRILKQRIKEHSTKNNREVKIHNLSTDHQIDFDDVRILDVDKNRFRLFVKESPQILEHRPNLNRMMSSFDLKLFVKSFSRQILVL